MGALLRLKGSRPLPHTCFWTAAMDAMDPVYASELERWAQVLLHCLVPNPQGWQYFHEVGTDTTVLSRGTFQPTTVLDVERLYHGCTLGILHRILREGFRVGGGQHGHHGITRHGMFAMEAPDGYQAHARRLAFQRAWDNEAEAWPTMWSTPVVLGIHVPRYQFIRLLPSIGGPPLHKVCIPMDPGTVADLDTLSVLGYGEAAHGSRLETRVTRVAEIMRVFAARLFAEVPRTSTLLHASSSAVS